MKFMALMLLWWWITGGVESGAACPVLLGYGYLLWRIYHTGYDVVVRPDRFTR